MMLPRPCPWRLILLIVPTLQRGNGILTLPRLVQLFTERPAALLPRLVDENGHALGTLAPGAAANQAFLDEVGALQAVDVAPALPDISGSLRALRERPGAAAPHAPPAGAAPVDAGSGGQ